MAADETQVRALTEFFTRDTDASRFCGLGAGATIEDVKSRFGEQGFVHVDQTRIGKQLVDATVYKGSDVVELGGVSWKRFTEVHLPLAAEKGFPFIDVRFVREGHVMAEVKATVVELKKIFMALHGKSMTFERGGVQGEVWVEATGAKANEAAGLKAAAAIRVRVSPRR
jgi:hypothetical protein